MMFKVGDIVTSRLRFSGCKNLRRNIYYRVLKVDGNICTILACGILKKFAKAYEMVINGEVPNNVTVADAIFTSREFDRIRKRKIRVSEHRLVEVPSFTFKSIVFDCALI